MIVPHRFGLLQCKNSSLDFPRVSATFPSILNSKTEEESSVESKQRWGAWIRKTKPGNTASTPKSPWPYSRNQLNLIRAENLGHKVVGSKRYVHLAATLNSRIRPRIKPFRHVGPTTIHKYSTSDANGSNLASKHESPFSNLIPLSEAAPGPLANMALWSKQNSSIRFLSTPTVDTPGTSLILFFDDKRYLVGNIHEGISRASIQMGSKLGKVSDIFITGKIEWKNTGGLMGLILSVADSVISSAQAASLEAKQKAANRAARNNQVENPDNRNLQSQQQKPADSSKLLSGNNIESTREDRKPALTLHGGPNLAQTIASARRFIFRTGMPVVVDELTSSKRRNALYNEWKPDWADETIQVWSMPVTPISPDKTNMHPNPESPLKRRFGDLAAEEQTGSTETTDVSEPIRVVASPSVTDQDFCNSVISHMFDSPWRSDQLEKTTLDKVGMPGTIFVHNKMTKKIEPYHGPMPDGIRVLPPIDVLVRKPWPGALVSELPPTQPSEIAMSYIIRTHPRRGTFHPEKARALNVPRGPLFAALTAGTSVESADGQTITPDMVLGKGREGNGVAVVELPSAEYVHNLVNRPEWQAPRVMTGVGAIIWILGPGVGQNEELQKFLNDNNHLKHVVSSQDHCPNNLAFDSSASAAIRLHQIDSSRFPIPIHNNVPISPTDQSNEQSNGFKFIQAQRGLEVQIEPAVAIKSEQIMPILDIAAVLQETPQEVLKLAQIAKENRSSESAQQEMADQNLPSPDAEIVCLGTGSALPSKYRNVSATLLRVPGSGSYLLDCGENTLGQLKRIYGPTELGEVLRDLKLIWISHLHADHHLGITAVIKAWNDEVHGNTSRSPQRRDISLDGKRLFVVSSTNMMNWLREYSSVEDYGYNHLVPLSSTTNDMESKRMLRWKGSTLGFDPKHREICDAWKENTGLAGLEFAYVDHCKYAQAVSLTFPTGFKFSYSGDCRPSKIFAKIGKGSTVLLHEATFDDELIRDAKAKKHSTVGEAIRVGIAMGARRILLTHFSQRYQNIPVLSRLEGSDVKLEDDAASHSDTAKVLDDIEDSDFPLADPSFDEIIKETPDSYIPQPTLSTKSPIAPQNLKDLKVAVAFDYMRVKVRDIIHMEKLTPALLKLYERPELDEVINKVVGEKLDLGSDEMSMEGKGKGKDKKERKEKGKEKEKAKGKQKRKEKETTPSNLIEVME